MAFMTCDVSSDGKRVMSLEQFKRWLKQFVGNKDGQISQANLRDAILSGGGWFATLKSKRAFQSADVNHNGVIDEEEFKNLVRFAEKHLNVRVI